MNISSRIVPEVVERINEGVGIVNSDRRTIIYTLLGVTAEDKLLHFYETDNKEVFTPDIKRSNITTNLYLRTCNDFDFAICHSVVKLSTPGLFKVGEKLKDLNIARTVMRFLIFKKYWKYLTSSTLLI